MKKVRLTDREMEIVLSGAKGHKDVAIAQQLKVSPLTVKSFWARIFSKTGCESRGEVISLVVTERYELELAAQKLRLAAFEQKLLSDGALLKAIGRRFHLTYWIVDLKLRIQQLETPEEALIGWVPRWRPGIHIREMFGGGDQGRDAEEAHRAALDGEESAFVVIGPASRVKIVVVPIPNDEGGVLGAVGIAAPYPITNDASDEEGYELDA